MSQLFTIAILCFLVTSCYEPSEGCLDRSATNFDLSADEACSDCCTYPNLKIRFDNKWEFDNELVNFSTDSVFYDGLNQPFFIDRIRFYWSNYALDLIDGSQIPITNLIDIRVPDGGDDTITLTMTDHFLLADISSSQNSLTLGNLSPIGTITGLSTNFGIARPENGAITTEFDTSHPLAPQEGGMNLGNEQGYIFAKVKLYRDTSQTDSVTVSITGDDALRFMSLSLPTPLTLVEGFNPLLVIETDFTQWFSGINVVSDDSLSMGNQMIDNIVSSFTLKEVLAD